MNPSFRLGRAALVATGVLALGACSSSSEPATPTPNTVALSTERPNPDPRVGLAVGQAGASMAQQVVHTGHRGGRKNGRLW